jgi:hypothetical protein
MDDPPGRLYHLVKASAGLGRAHSHPPDRRIDTIHRDFRDVEPAFSADVRAVPDLRAFAEPPPDEAVFRAAVPTFARAPELEPDAEAEDFFGTALALTLVFVAEAVFEREPALELEPDALALVAFFAPRFGRFRDDSPAMPRTARAPASRTAAAPSATVSPKADRAFPTPRPTLRADRLTVFTAELAAPATGSVIFSSVPFDRFFALMLTSWSDMSGQVAGMLPAGMPCRDRP